MKITKTDQLRLFVLCFATASIGLSMALISIAKLLLLLCGAWVLLTSKKDDSFSARRQLGGLYTPVMVFVVLGVFVISASWASGPWHDTVGSIAKYGKFLSLPLVLLLVRNRRDATFALAAFLVAQTFLVLSSWLLYFHVPLFYATSNMAVTENAVFSSYLDQGIITAAAGAVFWHFRDALPWKYGKQAAIAMAAICIANVLFALSGRTGHVVSIAMLTLAIMWQLPVRWRVSVVVLPFVILAVLFVSSDKVHLRVMQVKDDISNYSYTTKEKQVTSAGIRLEFWMSSLKAISERPLIGSGVGSWSTEYNRVNFARNPAHEMVGGNFNPHEEYLLWGVQLGALGILLFIALITAAILDGWRFSPAAQRATQSLAVALAVACFFNSSIYDALIGDFFCIGLGLMLATGLHYQPMRTSKTAARPHLAEA